MSELRVQGATRTGPTLQPEYLPQMWNNNDQRLIKTSQEQGDLKCQVEMEQALPEWAQ